MHVLLPFPYHRWFFGLVVLVLLVAPYPLWAPPMGLMRFGMQLFRNKLLLGGCHVLEKIEKPG